MTAGAYSQSPLALQIGLWAVTNAGGAAPALGAYPHRAEILLAAWLQAQPAARERIEALAQLVDELERPQPQEPPPPAAHLTAWRRKGSFAVV